MDTSPETASQRVKTYQRIKLSLGILSSLVAAVCLLLIVYTGLTLSIYHWCVSVFSSPALSFLLYAASISTVIGIITLPISFTSSYLIEHRYGLSNQTIAHWCVEQLKGLAVGSVLGVPVLLFFYWCSMTFNEFWWFPMSIALLVLFILLSRIAPVLILPLFYKLTPLPDSLLKTRIEELCRDHGIFVNGIFEFNLSKNTKKANAAFTGIGKSKRVLLADTLLHSFPEDEILSVYAHELGHHKHHHLWKGIMLGAVHTFAAFYLSSIFFTFLSRIAGFHPTNFIPALPLLALSLSMIGILTAPMFNAISRKYEREADLYAVKIFGQHQPFISALERLAMMNLTDVSPHPLVEFLFYSHPSIKKRIAAIQHISLSS